jgi:hypothetical protein
MTCAICEKHVAKGEATNEHHPIYQSNGGTEAVTVHKRCHVLLHSNRGDFREWGRKGGLVTASKGYWIFNLKDGKRPPDPLRWIPFGR